MKHVMDLLQKQDGRTRLLKRALGLAGLFLFCMVYRCPFYWLLHIKCPGCGMTHALLCALRLDFSAAFRWHCLFPVVPVCAAYVLFRDRFSLGKKREDAALAVIMFLFLARWVILFAGGNL